MGSDLHKPLGIGTPPRRWWQRIPYGMIGLTLIAGTVALAVIWMKFLPDPYGGDPVAVVRVDRTKTGIALKDIGVSGGAAAPDKGAPAADAHGGSGGHEPAAGHGAPEAGHGAAEAGHGAAAPQLAPSGAPKGKAQVMFRPGLPSDAQMLTSVPVARVTDAGGKYGPLPKLAPDGTRPLEIYARPVAKRAGTMPKVVIVVGGLGLSQTGTQEALRLMPPDVTMAFSPYGTSLDRWVAKARQEGHEVLIQLPMEPFDFPDTDPGPQTLMAGLSGDANIDRMRWVLSRITTFVGVINYMGGKFASNEASLGPVMKEITGRGLMYLDDGASSRSVAGDVAKKAETPFARADVVLDATASDAEIDARLAQLEGLARQKGVAIGTATALPVSMRRISEWAKGLEARGVVIVPVSAAVREGQG